VYQRRRCCGLGAHGRRARPSRTRAQRPPHAADPSAGPSGGVSTGARPQTCRPTRPRPGRSPAPTGGKRPPPRSGGTPLSRPRSAAMPARCSRPGRTATGPRPGRHHGKAGSLGSPSRVLVIDEREIQGGITGHAPTPSGTCGRAHDRQPTMSASSFRSARPCSSGRYWNPFCCGCFALTMSGSQDRVDLCTLSFASVGVHAIEASARFHGAVAGMRIYLLAAKALFADIGRSRWVVRRAAAGYPASSCGARRICRRRLR
jgi:hypothetical protein